MPESLRVSDCDSIEEIFDLQKVNFEESHSRAVMYHQLQQLNINRLPKLKHIWKKDPQAKLSFEELPMPESLRVSDCDSIEEIFDLQKVNFEESHSRAVTYRLQEVYIYGLPKLKHIWKKDPQAKLSFEELSMPESLKRFCHLHELHLESSSYKEIFSYEEDETHVGVDSKLDMVLSKLEKLTSYATYGVRRVFNEGHETLRLKFFISKSDVQGSFAYTYMVLLELFLHNNVAATKVRPF
ncbi:hypothetical protein Q3G72_027211 [Acer saccharum]|nr:hypothetical protein Q3G72_027211 [Acer saccharum]